MTPIQVSELNSLINNHKYIAQCQERGFVFIYGLRHPLSQNAQVRYVGCTKSDPADRLAAHLAEARAGKVKTPIKKWLSRLSKLGLTPKVVILSVCPPDLAADLETNWIEHFRGQGAYLLNRRRGGVRGGVFAKSTIAAHKRAAKTFSTTKRAVIDSLTRIVYASIAEAGRATNNTVSNLCEALRASEAGEKSRYVSLQSRFQYAPANDNSKAVA